MPEDDQEDYDQRKADMEAMQFTQEQAAQQGARTETNWAFGELIITVEKIKDFKSLNDFCNILVKELVISYIKTSRQQQIVMSYFNLIKTFVIMGLFDQAKSSLVEMIAILQTFRSVDGRDRELLTTITSAIKRVEAREPPKARWQ